MKPEHQEVFDFLERQARAEGDKTQLKFICLRHAEFEAREQAKGG